MKRDFTLALFRSLDQVMERIREAIALCLEVDGAASQNLVFVGIQ